jgi:hypothetical protein
MDQTTLMFAERQDGKWIAWTNDYTQKDRLGNVKIHTRLITGKYNDVIEYAEKHGYRLLLAN